MANLTPQYLYKTSQQLSTPEEQQKQTEAAPTAVNYPEPEPMSAANHRASAKLTRARLWKHAQRQIDLDG